jgi:hypothetical protein
VTQAALALALVLMLMQTATMRAFHCFQTQIRVRSVSGDVTVSVACRAMQTHSEAAWCVRGPRCCRHDESLQW